MLDFILPTQEHKDDVIKFYDAFAATNSSCIGYNGYKNYDKWLEGMQNRKNGINLPPGYVRENFYLCYEGSKLIGVFSLKFELTEFLRNFGGHVGYAVLPSERNRGLATQILSQGFEIAKKFNFTQILAICDEDNYASAKVIVKNGGAFENKLFDEDEKVFVNRYWIKV